MVFFIPSWITVTIIVFRVIRKIFAFLLEAVVFTAWAIAAGVVFLYRAVLQRGKGDDVPSNERRVRNPSRRNRSRRRGACT